MCVCVCAYHRESRDALLHHCSKSLQRRRVCVHRQHLLRNQFRDTIRDTLTDTLTDTLRVIAALENSMMVIRTSFTERPSCSSVLDRSGPNASAFATRNLHAAVEPGRSFTHAVRDPTNALSCHAAGTGWLHADAPVRVPSPTTTVAACPPYRLSMRVMRCSVFDSSFIHCGVCSNEWARGRGSVACGRRAGSCRSG